MLEKKSGTVGYAVVRCGGLLKGEVRHYPVPWDSLKYNVAREAYTTDVTLAELRSGHRNSTARRSTGRPLRGLSPSAVLVGVEQPTCREYMPPPARTAS
jgi:hypothetical protein